MKFAINDSTSAINANDLPFKIISTLLISIFFLVFNPFYALLFSSLVSLFYKEINFKIFSFLFALSFALLFTNRDLKSTYDASDVAMYVTRYAYDIGFIDSLINFDIEPFWIIYTKFLSIIFNGDMDLFVLFNHFLLFLLLAIIARKISKKNYIITLFCLVFFNLAVLLGIHQVWRNTFAILLIFIGVYSTRSKFLIYTAPLVHSVTLPLLVIARKIDYKVIIFSILVLVIMNEYILLKIDNYQEMEGDYFGFKLFFIVSVIMIAILKFLNLVKLNQIENRILVAFAFFAFLPIFFEFQAVYSIILSRMSNIFYLFTSIIVAKLIIQSNIISAIFIVVYSIYRFGFTFNNPVVFSHFEILGDGRPVYIYNGILMLIKGYDPNRWSDFVYANFWKLLTQQY